MTEHLTPALTAKEWAARQWETRGYEVNSVVTLGESAHLLQFKTVRDGRKWPSDAQPFARPTEFHALMALANAALPEGDARKITWTDVEDARTLVDLVQDTSRWYGATSDDERNRLIESHHRLMAKLAALLPPPSAPTPPSTP